jgi:hypothetical protein
MKENGFEELQDVRQMNPFSIFKLFLKLIPFIDQDEISRSILYMQICICPSTQILIGGVTGAPNKAVN